VGLLIVLVCAGAIYEGIESRRDQRQYHPPGRLVDIGGYRLHLYCIGEGSPTVILEAGAGIPGFPGIRCSREWRHSPGFVPMIGRDLDGVIPVRDRERPK
jgi:hypothetical protein